MDLTPQVINEVEFSMARRGYDPDQVDEFLEKVAVAVGELNERTAELRDRLAATERRAAELERRASERPERVVDVPAAPAGPSAQELSAAAEAELETLKRTLLLAQRTADAAVREAEADARRIIAEAEEQARAAHEATRQQVLAELAELQASRDALRGDVGTLEQHLAGQRSRLEGTIADLQRLVSGAERLGAVDVPAGVAPEQPTPQAAPAPAPERGEQPPGPSFVLADEVPDDVDDDEAWARFGGDDVDDLDAGPRTEPILRLDRVEQGGGDDAYLTELRKAMLDDTGAPDAADIGFFDDPSGARAARPTRFGRRR